MEHLIGGAGIAAGVYRLVSPRPGGSVDRSQQSAGSAYAAGIRRTVLLLPILAACVNGAVGDSEIVADSVAAATCPQALGVADAACGTALVRENWTDANSRRINVAYAVLPARANPGRRALFFITGGPGQSAIEGARSYASQMGVLRDSFDFVIVDQRGTGGSRPLRCRVPPGAATEEDMAAAAAACLAQYKDSVDLSQYTTLQAAYDIESIRRALGYDSISLDAGSYGTRVALVYLKHFGRAARAAVLRGVSPMDYRNPLPFPRAGQAAWDSLVSRCAADPQCRQNYPDLDAHLATVLTRLERTPVDVTLGQEKKPFRLDRNRFASLVHLMLFIPSLSAQLPRIMAEAADGRYDAVVSLGSAFEAAVEDQIYWGMQLGVVCSEDVPRITETDVKRETQGTFLGDRMIRDYQAACAQWPKARMPASFYEPARSAVPTLLVSGAHDPSTPPAFATAIARDLSHSRHIVINRATHMGHGECVDTIVAAFLRVPDPGRLDVRCIDDYQPPPFAYDR
jgi:pimeloyl-ACP methyl ester carboxylesterase